MREGQLKFNLYALSLSPMTRALLKVSLKDRPERRKRQRRRSIHTNYHVSTTLIPQEEDDIELSDSVSVSVLKG